MPGPASVPKTADENAQLIINTIKDKATYLHTKEDLASLYANIKTLYASLNAPAVNYKPETLQQGASLISGALFFLKRSGTDISNFESDVKAAMKSNFDTDALPNSIEAIKAANPDAFSNGRTYWANFFTVAKQFAGEGRIIDGVAKIDQIASFKTKIESDMKISQASATTLLVAMAEAADPKQSPPDLYVVKFGADKASAEHFKKTLGSLPFFDASYNELSKDNISGGYTVSFKLSENQNNEFVTVTAPSSAPAMAPSKQKPAKKTESGTSIVYKAQGATEHITYTRPDATSTLDEKEAMDRTEDKSYSAVTKSAPMYQAAACKYGMNYISDKTDTKKQVEDAVKADLKDLAKYYGYDFKDPIETWLITAKGKEFIARVNEQYQKSGTKMSITGSADAVVFFDGKNMGTWKSVADKNLKLAGQRASFAYDYLVSFGFDKAILDNKPKVHFFQDTDNGLPASAAKDYGYVQGEGQKNLQSLMVFLKNASNGISNGAIAIGEKEQSDAKKYYEKLISSGAVKVEEKTNAKGEKELTYTLGDISLLNKYFRRMNGDSTLKGVAGVKEGMMNEGETNIFVRAITESGTGSARSVSLSSAAKANLSIEICDADQKQGTAKLEVTYAVDKQPMDFNTSTNGCITVFFMDEAREKTPLEATMLVDKQGKPTGEFEVAGIPTDKKGKLMASAGTTGEIAENCVETGLVWKKLEYEAPKKKEITQTITPEHVSSSNAPSTINVPRTVGTADIPVYLPGSAIMSGDTPAAGDFNGAMAGLANQYGATVNPETGYYVWPELSGGQYVGMLEDLSSKMGAWCNLYAPYISTQLDPNNSNATLSNFTSLMQQGKFDEAAALLSSNSELRGAMNSLANKSMSNVRLNNEDINKLLRLRISTGIGVSFSSKEETVFPRTVTTFEDGKEAGKMTFKIKNAGEFMKVVDEFNNYTQDASQRMNFDAAEVEKQLKKLGKNKSSDVILSDNDGNKYRVKYGTDGSLVVTKKTIPKVVSLYMRGDQFYLVNDETIKQVGAGSTFLMKFDVGKMDIMPYVSAGGTQTSNKKVLVGEGNQTIQGYSLSFYTQEGVRASIPLADFLTGILDASATQQFAGKKPPLQSYRGTAGARVDLGRFNIRVQLSNELSPNQTPRHEAAVGAGYGTKDFTIGAQVGVTDKNIYGKYPVTVGFQFVYKF